MKTYQKYNKCYLAVFGALFAAGLSLIPAFGPVIAAEQPDLTFKVNPDRIETGETAVLSWFGQNIRGCHGYGDWSEQFYYPDYYAVGTHSIRPTETSTYGLTCSGNGGIVRNEVTVTVSQPGAAAFSFPPVTTTSGGSAAPISPITQTAAQPALTAGCAASPTTAAKGESVTFVGSFVGGTGIANYSWTGDISGVGKIITKVFSETGIKTAKLTVTDSGGASTAAWCSINVIEENAGNILGVETDKIKPAAGSDQNKNAENDPGCECADEKKGNVITDNQTAAIGRAQSFILWFVLALLIINFGFLFHISGRLGKLEKKYSAEVPV